MRYQVLRIAVPRKGRAFVAPFATGLRSGPSAGHQEEPEPAREQEALLAVVGVLPVGIRPVVLADRGFHRASFIAWLEHHRLDYVVRIKKGSCITETDGRRWKLGEEGLRPGEMRFVEQVRYGLLYHGRPRDLRINVALCWRISKSRTMNPRRKRPEEPWYLA
ncbi:MAG: transposase, partial [Actinobacteria bacterium]|nr:transposase [Actinomycetota bacterium]